MEDLISRSDLLDEINNANFEKYEDYSTAFDIVDKAPPAKYWHSTKDELPESEGFYLVFFNDYETVMMFFDPAQEEGERWGYWHNRFDSVTLGFIDSEFESVGDEYVSHWLKVPEIPDKRKDG